MDSADNYRCNSFYFYSPPPSVLFATTHASIYPTRSSLECINYPSLSSFAMEPMRIANHDQVIMIGKQRDRLWTFGTVAPNGVNCFEIYD